MFQLRQRKTKLAVLLASLAIAISTGSAYAEEDEGLFFGRIPVVYSASRMPQSQSETPNFVTVIDREMIRATGARELSDLLRLVPGFQVTSRNLEIPARVTFHGLSNEDYSPRLQVLIDGRSQYSALFGSGVNWDLLPVAIENIERIEVVRGSNVAAYGTNAFLGVVNIITMDASQTRGTTVISTSGSRGVSDQLIRFGDKIGDASLRLTYQGQADSGIRFIPQGSSDPNTIANGQHKRLFDLRADIPLTADDSISLSLGKIEGAMQVGRSDYVVQIGPSSLMTNPPRTIHQSSQYAQLEWLRALADGDEFRIHVHSTEDRSDDPPIFASNVLPLEQSGRSSRDEIEFQHTLNINSALRFLWGMGARQESVDKSYQFYAGNASRRVDRLFTHAEWRPAANWLLNLGASADRDSYVGEHVSPRASTSYQFSEGQTLRAGVSQAYRLPSFTEQVGYLNYVPVGYPMISSVEYKANGLVQAEKLLTREIGYFGDYTSWRATLDIRAFQENIPNRVQVLEVPAGGYDYAVNAQDVQIRGMEYQLRWQPLEGTRLVVGQSALQIQSQFQNVETANTTASVTRLARLERQTRNSAPAMTNMAMLMQDLPYELKLSVMLYQTDTMYWAPSKPASAYTRVDWRLAKPFTIGSTRGEVAYVVQSEEGAHAELKPSNMVMPRQWISVRFEL
jgi:iron complex outermembrane recepter protein